jgi:nitrate reductase delta subunit
MKTLKALSALLGYPTEALQAAAGELEFAIRSEALLPARERDAVLALVADIASSDIFDAQERYVLLFDRTRSLSLHLFEHVHGESRDRGQAMVDLLKVYEDGGYTPIASQLPDYLPLFLEFASTRPPAEAIDLVGQPGHVLAALRERLRRRGSVYEAAFAALVALGDARLDEATVRALTEEPDDDPNDLGALDAAWEDEEVTFGPDAAACGHDSLSARLRQARRPAPGITSVPVDGRPAVTPRPSARP